MPKAAPTAAEPRTERAHRRSRRHWVQLIALLVIAGYVLLAYCIVPLLWIRYALRHPALEHIPHITYAGDDHPGDPVNLLLIGSEGELKKQMLAAGWFPADPLTLRSCLEIAAATVLRKQYEDAPVSSLFLFKRKQDLAFEMPVGGNPAQRHHVRFWGSAEVNETGRPAWMGAASYDQTVGVSHTTGEITHHIDKFVDHERDHVLATLKTTGGLVATDVLHGFHKVVEGRNGGGDRWVTDGDLAIGVLAQE